MSDQTETPTAPPNPFDAEFLIKQARSYLAFGEQMSAFSAQLHGRFQDGEDWGSMLRQNFDRFKAATLGSVEDAGTASEHDQLWTQMLELWRQSVSAIGLGAPVGGETDAWRGYMQVQDQYLDLLRQSASAALDLLEQRLRDRAATGKSIDSLRELYNLWVDCNEKTYGQMLRGAEYGELNGRLFNSLLQCYSKREARP